MAGVYLLFHPLLSNLPNDDRSYYLSLISLVPLFWLAAIDYEGHVRDKRWIPTENQHITVRTVLVAAGFLALVHIGVSYLRFISTGEVHLRASELLVVLSWSLASHVLVFTLTFVAICLIRNLSIRFANASKIEFLLLQSYDVPLAHVAGSTNGSAHSSRSTAAPLTYSQSWQHPP